MKNPVVRIRINSLGLQVWNAGKWIVADSKIANNVTTTLRNLFPSQTRAAA